MAFCTFEPIWSPKARLARWGRSNPFSHAHRENWPIFQNKGFPLNQRWIMCRWSLQYHWGPPEHPRDTSHTFSASCCRLPIRPVCGILAQPREPAQLRKKWRCSPSCSATPTTDPCSDGTEWYQVSWCVFRHGWQPTSESKPFAR